MMFQESVPPAVLTTRLMMLIPRMSGVSSLDPTDTITSVMPGADQLELLWDGLDQVLDMDQDLVVMGQVLVVMGQDLDMGQDLVVMGQVLVGMGQVLDQEWIMEDFGISNKVLRKKDKITITELTIKIEIVD